jgi:hypothetical protein
MEDSTAAVQGGLVGSKGRRHVWVLGPRVGLSLMHVGLLRLPGCEASTTKTDVLDGKERSATCKNWVQWDSEVDMTDHDMCRDCTERGATLALRVAAKSYPYELCLLLT